MIETVESAAEQAEINAWCYVEIFGHTRLAGRVTTKKFGAQIMFQVDVPKGEMEFSHSELFSPNAIFSIKPTTEEWCRKWNAAYRGQTSLILPYVPEARQLASAQEQEQEMWEEHEEP